MASLDPDPDRFGSRTVKMASDKEKTSVADPGCLSRIPDPVFSPSRIPDPGSRIPDPGSNQKGGGKIFF